VSLAPRLVATWYARRVTLWAALLWPLSLLYRAAVALRRWLFATGILRAHRLPVPVIVVGNITVGGAGKTPLTDALATALAQRGHRPGIISRGYGGTNVAPRAVTANDDPAVVGDEALIHAGLDLPVWIGHDRVAAGRGLLAAHPACTVLIADDGLQHYALARAMDIVVVDAARELGNGLLLPAGPLREPAARLRDVDAIVRLVGSAEGRPGAAGGRETVTLHEALPWRNVHRRELRADPRQWRGQEVHAVSGIAHPQRFFDMVRAQGIAATTHEFADHHPFTASEIAFPGAVAILMTQKDAVKCTAFADERFWFLPLRATIDPALLALVEEKIHSYQAA
jgi:tetraacyldisaccharide 4'-kinase